MRRLLLAAIFLSAAATSAQPRPPLTRALADALYTKLAGGSTIAGTTTFNNLTISGTCTGCSSGSVPTTRLISTTSPLGGGGDLSADRTLTCTTCATSANNLSFFSATTSAQLLALISNETGSGLVMGNDTPTILTPTIASFVNSTHTHQNAAGGGTLVDAAITFTAPALGAPTSTTFQTSGNVGIGTTPSATTGQLLNLLATGNFITRFNLSNADASDTGSQTVVRVAADTAITRLDSYGTGATGTAFGVTLGGYSVVDNGAAGNGLVIGTTNSAPLIIGTNSTRGLTIAAASQAVSIRGTQTNDSATTGDVGELISGTVAANTTSLSTGTSINVGTNTNITLTAGDWDCTGVVNFTYGATTSVTNLAGGVSTTTGTLPAQDSYFDFETAASVPTAAAVATWPVPTVRVSVAGSTGVFLVTQATFSVSTVKAGGTIRCRRMR